MAMMITSSTLPTYAHVLIPAGLQEYIKNHPNATPQDFKNFADEQAPEFSQKFKDGVEITNIIRNNNTNFFDNAYDFLKLGVGHILSGFDHILFVLSLILVIVSVREIFQLTTTFTVAHSITLLLTGTGILSVSPKITEPLIALSIVYVSLMNAFGRKNTLLGGKKAKLISVFFFGLFHGLGFAGLLKEIQIPVDKFLSSLFSFNLGIEIGQLMIITIALPILYIIKDKNWYPKFIKMVALLMAILATYWVIERIYLF